ncbi:MAG TPA: lysophospholipid acyltransferase family protein [Ignavibacteriales bacterium]|nr:lysophospholipid acyltransferase family protein [Ignavibacteriales bacterium]
MVKIIDLYTLLKIKTHFKEIKIITKSTFDKEKPILILGNHFSWWDGFWMEYINIKLLKKNFYFMMLEEELIKRPLLKYAGAYSIKKNSFDILESLKFTSELLSNKNNIVLLFPQGKIQSLHIDDVKFQKGIYRIVKDKDIEILFINNFIEYFSDIKPTVFSFIKNYKFDENIEKAFNDFYKENLNYLQNLR